MQHELIVKLTSDHQSLTRFIKPHLISSLSSASSSIFDTNEGAAILYRLLAGLMQGFDNGADNLRGVAPFLTGVETGSAISNCSGLKFGPNDTRFLDFLVDTGVVG